MHRLDSLNGDSGLSSLIERPPILDRREELAELAATIAADAAEAEAHGDEELMAILGPRAIRAGELLKRTEECLVAFEQATGQNGAAYKGFCAAREAFTRGVAQAADELMAEASPRSW